MGLFDRLFSKPEKPKAFPKRLPHKSTWGGFNPYDKRYGNKVTEFSPMEHDIVDFHPRDVGDYIDTIILEKPAFEDVEISTPTKDQIDSWFKEDKPEDWFKK